MGCYLRLLAGFIGFSRGIDLGVQFLRGFTIGVLEDDGF